MRLNAPTKNVFWIAVILAVLGVASVIVPGVVFFAWQAFILVLVGFVVLAAGCVLKGL